LAGEQLQVKPIISDGNCLYRYADPRIVACSPVIALTCPRPKRQLFLVTPQSDRGSAAAGSLQHGR
jgi:hypothetical protein